MIRQSSKNYAYRLKKRKTLMYTQEDKRQVHKLFKTFRRYEAICGIFSFLTIIGLVADYEAYYNISSLHSTCNLEDSKTENYRIIVVFTTFISIYCLICKYITEDTWINVVLHLTPDAPVKFSNKEYKTKKKYQMIVEIILLMVIPVPYWDAIIKLPQHFQGENLVICYRFASLILCISFLRIYFVFRSLLNFSIFNNEQALIFCIKNQVDTGIGFAIKCIMNTYPLPLIGCMTISTISIGMFIAKIFERPMEKHIEIFYDSSPNYLWFLVVTIGTQGYGDYTCVTYGCRLVTFIVWFFGSAIVGLLIVYMQKLSELNHFESKTFNKIRMSVLAARVLKAWVRFIKARKRGEKNLSKYHEFIQKESYKFKEFRLIQKAQSKKNENFNVQIEKIRKDIRAASQKLDQLIKLYTQK